MNKEDEIILAVSRKILFNNEALSFDGLLTQQEKIQYYMNMFYGYVFSVRRGDAEVNDNWKQPIPYAIVKRGDEVFLYKRLSGSGESKLHDQLSIGVGGHMNPIVKSWDKNFILNQYRELGEELDIVFNSGVSHDSLNPRIVGLINDDKNEVGRVHIGILTIVELPIGTEVTVRETDKLEGHWIRIRDLKKSPLFESLETWSQMAVEVL